MNSGRRWPSRFAKSSVSAANPPTYTVAPDARGRLRDHVVAQVVQQRARRLVLRRGRRVHAHDRGRARRVGERGRDRRDAGRRGDGRLQLVERRSSWSAPGGQLDREQERAVEAGAEAFGQRGRTPRASACPAGRCRRRRSRAAATAPAARARARSRGRRWSRNHAWRLHEPAPAVPHGLAACRRRRCAPTAAASWSMFVPTKPSTAGSNVTAAATVTATTAAAPMPESADERQADREHAEQRDDHGEAGEQHRPTRRVDRGDDRFFGVEARRAVLGGSA